MKTTAFIPARYDSTRFPGKPLALIAGKPMVQRVYQCALACPDISEVFVATDDKRIFDCVHGFNGNAVMTEGEHPSGTDRIYEATRKLGLAEEDLIVNIQGDQPWFQPSVISLMIAPLLEDANIPMGTLKYRISGEKDVNNPNYVKVVTNKDGFALFFSRSPIPFFRDSSIYRDRSTDRFHYKHLGFYVYRQSFLSKFAGFPVGQLEAAEKLEQLRALENGFRIKVVETPFDSIEVDAKEDIKKVEQMLAREGNTI